MGRVACVGAEDKGLVLRTRVQPALETLKKMGPYKYV